MGTTIAIINRKGGVGKTTTSLCMADALRVRGMRTLLVDLDQQHNATKQYGAEIEGKTTAFDLLTDPSADLADAVQATECGDIVAGDDLINRAEAEMSGLTGRDFMLADALAKVEGDYDYIIIDCSPSLGIVSTNALIAADEVIVPMMCDGYCVDSFDGLFEAIDQIRSNPRLNPDLKIAGMLVTMYQPTHRLTKAFDADLPAYAEQCGTRVFDTKIRICCKVKEAQQLAKSLFSYAPDCTSATDYSDFVTEYLEEKETRNG
jgi:chromosome partitioning protein